MRRVGLIFSLNDPRWGRSQGNEPLTGVDELNQNTPDLKDQGSHRKDSPPDLDELWRDFNHRLTNLFRRKNGNQGKSSGTKSTSGLGLIVAIVIAALIFLASGIFIVQEGQVGVVTEFGRYKYTTTSGIQWRFPYPFQSHEIVNMSQIRSVEVGRPNTIRDTDLKDSSMLTSDENIIDVRFAVQYRIKDASELLFNNLDAESSVGLAAATAVREIVGKSKMDFVLYAGREEIANELVSSIQRILDGYKSGIIVTTVTIQSVQPPEQVQAAFDDAIKAGQDLERLKNEAQSYANDVVPRAQGTASRLTEDAAAYKARTVSAAQGDADRFKAVQEAYAKAPAVTRERMYLEAMQQIYSRTTKILIDTKSNNNMLYLPLDKIMEHNRAESITEVTPAAAGKMSDDLATADDYDRSPERLRNRERDSR
ncbi:FtsH protease activity modulator HflK [Candidatus Pandoraea novymonadis]|uniref:Protein HflK n=1 Tax=Candidatus Pandoraea novymonadis TaxID=1808959 RepID=A0ABX5FDY5_9BURK|nr:FtsH protease activity modulator HflK [Candidatus Pandoraea novymonadis]PSB91938.1 Modulator of FtsH protease HflK [Candidatus Pandoraea novymonadis]